MQRKFYALLFTVIMLAGIASPFVFTPTSAQLANQINPAWPTVNLLVPGANPTRQSWALLIANSFASVGITAVRQIVPFSPTTYDRMLAPPAENVGKNWSQGGFDIGFIGYAMSPNPTGVYGLFHSSQIAPVGQNYYLWNDSYADALSYNVTHTIDRTQRLVYEKLWQQYEYDQTPDVTLFYTKEIVAFKPSFQSAPFQNNHYPLWPGVEYWNDTAGTTSVTIAQTGPFATAGEGLVPYLTTSYYDLTFYGPIYGEKSGFGLLTMNQTFLMEPYMAYGNYTHSTDGKNWTFWIKPGIKFQDGTTLNGKDFVYTLRYEMTPGSGSAETGVYGVITSIICGADVTAGIAAGYGNKSVYWAGEAGTPGASLPYNPYEVHVNERAPWAFTEADIGGLTIMPAEVLVNSSSGIPDYNAWVSDSGIQGRVAAIATTSYNTGTAGTYVYYNQTGHIMPARSGPFGAGPYEFVNYVTGTAQGHLTKFANYFQKATLEAAGVYRFTDYYVTTINLVTPAITALQSGSVQVLDSQYQLGNSLSALASAGASHVVYDAYGVQEMGFNMQNPIWGTGLGTPLGQRDPSQAKAAAAHVRRAIDYLVPKDQIIKQLLNGFGTYGVTTPVTRVTDGFDTSIQIRNYTYPVAIGHAVAELEAAGYTFGTPTQPSLLEAYGLLIIVVELAVIIVLAGFYFFRPRKL